MCAKGCSLGGYFDAHMVIGCPDDHAIGDSNAYALGCSGAYAIGDSDAYVMVEVLTLMYCLARTTLPLTLPLQY